jgi:hypothetical protein
VKAALGGALVATVASLAAPWGCSKKSDAPPAVAPAVALAGLAAVPADATAVISVDATRVTSSPLVQRGVDLVVGRSPGLRERWTQLAAQCQVGLGAQVRRVVIALGPVGTPAAPQPVLLVVLGSIGEAQFASCARGVFGAGSGTVTTAGGGSAAGSALVPTQVAGRNVYRVDDAGRSVWFTYGQPDTMVLSTSSAWLTAAVGGGAKVGTDAGWQALVGHADQAAPIWAAGAVTERVGAGLRKVTDGKVAAGPSQFVASLDPAAGAAVELGAVTAGPADAAALLELADAQLGLFEKVAQKWSLGHLVGKVNVRAEGPLFWVSAALSSDEVNQVLVVIDTPQASPQDARP